MDKENVPEYIKVSDWLRYQVTSHKLIPGQKIYSENELCRMFCLSRQTIRHSINILINEEILESHRGSGTYVCDPEKIRPSVMGEARSSSMLFERFCATTSRKRV